MLVEWNGYPLSRKKKLGENKIICGIGPLLKGLSGAVAGVDFDLHLVVNCSEGKPFYKFSPLKKHYRKNRAAYVGLKDKYDFIKSVTFRGNDGMDIGAYNDIYSKLVAEGCDGHILFMNSSVLAPKREGWLKSYQAVFDRSVSLGACGISMNSHNTNLSPPEFMPHIQSFFIYTSFNVMEKVFPNAFPTGGNTQDKITLIESGEIGISTALLESGYGITSMAFPDFEYNKGDKWLIPEGDLRFEKKYRAIANQA